MVLETIASLCNNMNDENDNVIDVDENDENGFNNDEANSFVSKNINIDHG